MNNDNTSPWFSFLRIATVIIIFVPLDDYSRGQYVPTTVFVCGVTAYLAYIATKKHMTGMAWLYGFTALVFNPIFQAKLHYRTWGMLTILAIIVIICSHKVIPWKLKWKQENHSSQKL